MMDKPSTKGFKIGISSYNMEYTADWDPENDEFRILEDDLKIIYKKVKEGVLTLEEFEYNDEEKAGVVNEAMKSRLRKKGWAIQ